MRVLRTQLQEFVGAFISHDDGTRDSNVWIIKPARLSRSRGIVIADDLTSLLEACTQAVVENNPAVVSRYVVQPALYQGRKFDLRFVVALRAVHPLLLSIYDGWLVRVADEKYSVGDYANVRKHLTVMQYLDDGMDTPVRREWVRKDQLIESLVSSFGPTADEQHVREVCHTTILECFSLATSGISGAANELVGIDPNSPHKRVRGVYGVDVMLRPRATCTRMQDCPLEAVILEINYKPDLHRILQEDASFFDDLFPVLFDEIGDQATGQSRRAIPNWASYYEHTKLD
jgi:tubulin--tyrosine ligase-like protein 12